MPAKVLDERSHVVLRIEEQLVGNLMGQVFETKMLQIKAPKNIFGKCAKIAYVTIGKVPFFFFNNKKKYFWKILTQISYAESFNSRFFYCRSCHCNNKCTIKTFSISNDYLIGKLLGKYKASSSEKTLLVNLKA